MKKAARSVRISARSSGRHRTRTRHTACVTSAQTRDTRPTQENAMKTSTYTLISLSLFAAACGAEPTPPTAQSLLPSFEELKATAPREPDGRYVLEGDMTFDEAELADYYEHVLVPRWGGHEDHALGDDGLESASDPLTVSQRWVTPADICTTSQYCPPAPCGPVLICSGLRCHTETRCAPPPPCVPVVSCTTPPSVLVDDVWSATQRRDLRFCIAREVSGATRTRLVDAAVAAANAWNNVAGVRFVYDASQDDNCNAGNTNVVFDIHVNFSSPSYAARAFFPSQPRATRNVQVESGFLASASLATLTSVMTHELGHALGFRHEHIRSSQSGAPQECQESAGLNRTLTPYDGRSVMHYSQCNGALPALFTRTAMIPGAGQAISARDVEGARLLYGNPL
jgi:hypothetical protein